MKKIYTNESLITVEHLKNVLEHAGIRSELKNDRLLGALGEIPLLDRWPELWVNEADVSHAKRVLAETLETSSERPPWSCQQCGEEVDGPFEICWNCGAARQT